MVKNPLPILSNALWDILEGEADELFYIEGKDWPAFILMSRNHPFNPFKGHVLYMSHVGLIAIFRTKEEALQHLRKIIENANVPVRVWRVLKRWKERGKRVFFAENTIERIDSSKAIGPIKVFNIKEWGCKEA